MVIDWFFMALIVLGAPLIGWRVGTWSSLCLALALSLVSVVALNATSDAGNDVFMAGSVVVFAYTLVATTLAVAARRFRDRRPTRVA